MDEKQQFIRWTEIEPFCVLRLLVHKLWLIVMAALIGATVRDIPAFTLTCRPDVEAAEVAYEFLSQV